MNSPLPERPILFLKPSTALVADGGEVLLPEASSNVHHEVELVVVMGRRARQVPAENALEAVAGYAVGLDMTARDLQGEAKKTGTPWAVAKGFDTFAPLGEVSPAAEVVDPSGRDIELSVNGQVRQSGNTSDMIFSVPLLIAYCSTVFTLEPGDLIFTGTPDGVGPVESGDVLRASIAGLKPLHVRVTRPTVG